MRATAWEFKNRALVFGLLASVALALYLVDPKSVVEVLPNAVEHRFGIDAYDVALALLSGAALLIAVAALLRTWASAYLQSSIVYGSEIKTATLVADGPYRFVRNPLYLANVWMAIGLGMLMSRAGLVFNIVAMVAFCYRLILREEAEMRAAQATHFADYVHLVPRLWPSLSPRVPSSALGARWNAGFKAESWYWCFVLLPAAFAVTLRR